MKVIVKRSNWYRGKGSTGSFLRRTDDTMCCLGFAAVECGYKPPDILNGSSPWSMRATSKWPADPHTTDNDAVYAILMRTNDDRDISDEEREARLIEEGKAVELEFEFED